MTPTEIKEQIEEKKQQLEEALKVENEELKLYQDFFKKYSLIDVKKHDQIDCAQFFVLYAHSTNPEKWPIKEMEDIVKSNHLLFLKADSDNFQNIIKAVRFLIDAKDAYDIKKVMQEKSNPRKPTLFEKIFRRKELKGNPKKATVLNKISTLFNKLFQKKELEEETIKKNLTELKESGCDIEKLLDLIEKEDKDLKEAFSLVKMIKESGEFKEAIGEELKIFLKQDNLAATQEEIKKVTDKTWEAIIDKKRLFKALDVMKSYYEKLIKKAKNRNKTLNKELRDYKQFEELFAQALKGKEVKNVEEITDKISNPLLRLEVLKYIYLRNLSYQEQVESDYKNVFREESAEYKEFLLRNNLSTDNLESYMTKSIPELEYMIERLKKLNIEEVEPILKNSIPSRVQEIEVLIKKGVVTEDFVKENISLFDIQKPHYQVLTTNQKILQENRISPSTIHKHQEVLFTTPAYLERNFSTLQEYSLPLNWMEIESAQFLMQPNLVRKIDNILELGYESLLESNIELLNYKDSAWDRIAVLKSLKIPLPTTKEELVTVLESPNFFISEEEQRNYITPLTPYIKQKGPMELVPQMNLPAEQETTRTYTIGGVIFSKPKIQRNLLQREVYTPDTTLACITAGTNMQEMEYQNVKKKLISYEKK